MISLKLLRNSLKPGDVPRIEDWHSKPMSAEKGIESIIVCFMPILLSHSYQVPQD